MQNEVHRDIMKTVEEQMEQETGNWPGDLDYAPRYTG